jgi:ATP-binding protein involved in chromosome partitioning
MVPRENYRVRAMSFSFFVKEGDAVALRGPMVNSAFDRMAFGTDWGPLDVLVVDMPPGEQGICAAASDGAPLACTWSLISQY